MSQGAQTLLLPRRMRLYRQRVDCSLQLFRQQSIYHPVPLQPRLACERPRCDAHPEMRFACSVKMRLMPRVQMALIDDFQALRVQRRLKLVFNI
jgi:hypothetical protein